jgi:hypothetical protein
MNNNSRNATERNIRAVLRLANIGAPCSPEDIYKELAPRRGARNAEGVAYEFIGRVKYLPWLTVQKTEAGYLFVVDEEFRSFCEMYRPGSVGKFSLARHLLNLRKEITRVRSANKCERDRLRWNSLKQDIYQLISLMDFVEEELDKIPTPTQLGASHTDAEPSRDRAATIDRRHVAKERKHDSQSEGGTPGLDTAVSN